MLHIPNYVKNQYVRVQCEQASDGSCFGLFVRKIEGINRLNGWFNYE